jgi:hypothetical protein
LEVHPNSSVSRAVAIACEAIDAKLSHLNLTFIHLKDDDALRERSIAPSNLNDTYQVQEGNVIIVPNRKTFTALNFIADWVNPFIGYFGGQS